MMRMTKMGKGALITGIIALVSLAIALTIGASTGLWTRGKLDAKNVVTVDERKSLPRAGVTSVSISTVSERIVISEGTGPSFEAWLHGKVGSGSPALIPHLFADAAGAAARMDVKRTQNLGWLWSDLVLEVSLPKGYTGRCTVESVSGAIELGDLSLAGVSLETTSGGIEVGAVKAGDFVMHTTSGSLRAEGASAQRTELSSVSGSIEVGGLGGVVSARSTSGHITLAFAQPASMTDVGDASGQIVITGLSGAVRAQTTSGRIALGFTQPPLGADVESTSGSITLKLPAASQFLLDAGSTSGSVRCAFPLTVAETQQGMGKHSLLGTVGSGTARLSLHTVSGGIKVIK